MRFQSTMIDPVLILQPLTESIDSSVATVFKTRVIDFIQQGSYQIILDLSQVTFMDSSGLGAIVSILKTLGEDGKIILCNVNSAIRSLFRLTRFDRIIPICGSTDEACRMLNVVSNSSPLSS
ncbi:MAG: STAS domain-containing protein [Thermodesulfobacteriota bacterium]